MQTKVAESEMIDAGIRTRILAGLALGEREAHKISRRFGHWDKERNFPEVFCKIYQDAGIALETITVGDGPSKRLDEFSRAEEALADIIIRIFDISQGMNLNVACCVIAKMDFNHAQSKLVKKEF